MRTITKIIVHCTGSDHDSSAAEIDAYHKSLGWDGIGYHFLVRQNGDIEAGRFVDRIGAHAYGHNANSIGVAYSGGGSGVTRTDAQRRRLGELLSILSLQYPRAEILGHRDLPGVKKDCPQFDVKSEYGFIRSEVPGKMIYLSTPR